MTGTKAETKENTKRCSGVGPATVAATVRKSGGFVRAGGPGREFCVDVLLRVKTDEEGA